MVVLATPTVTSYTLGAVLLAIAVVIPTAVMLHRQRTKVPRLRPEYLLVD